MKKPHEKWWERKHARWLLLTCSDSRIHDILADRFVVAHGQPDLYVRPGGPLAVNDPAKREATLQEVRLLVEGHHLGTIVIAGHVDCAAYRGRAHFDSEESEIAFHRSECEKAVGILREVFPQVQYRTFVLGRHHAASHHFSPQGVFV